ncbi:nucleoside-triphosphatase [candidate division TA06 bacterium]|nr:nucleoside-triphosphatase [candidate division TA06 bacterium]
MVGFLLPARIGQGGVAVQKQRNSISALTSWRLSDKYQSKGYMIKNFLLTGRPRVGKTTLIREVIQSFTPEGQGGRARQAGGFYTREIREKGKRIGFEIETLSGVRGILASVNGTHQRRAYRVGRYQVHLEELERIGVQAIFEAVREREIVVIDEIGKMELLSMKFQDAVSVALDSPKKVLGTIYQGSDPFVRRIQAREDVKTITLTSDNYGEIKAIFDLRISERIK